MKLAIGILTFNEEPAGIERLYRSMEVAFVEAVKEFPLEILFIAVDNGGPLVEKILERVFPQSAPKSENGTRECRAGLSFQVLPTAGNVGFGTAFNRLMETAFQSCDAFLACNPDAAMHYDCLKELVRAHHKTPDAILEARQFPEEHPKVYDRESGATEWATGGCIFIPKAVYDLIGGFDQRLFIYGEDVDFSWRARAAGFPVKLVETAIFAHSTYGRKWSPRMKRLLFLANIYLACKWSREDYVAKYSDLYFSRFGKNEDELLAVEQMIEKGRNAKSDLNKFPSTGFIPYFDDAWSYSPVRWTY